MIKLIDILTPERTLNDIDIPSKKRILETASQLVAHSIQASDIDEMKIFNGLIARERLGSTGIGEGIAIPHCRLEGLDKTLGVLFHLKSPIDFDAIDNKPVDLIIVLVVPEKSTDEHLQLLSSIADKFSNESLRKKLRHASSNQNLYELAVN